MTSSRVVFPAPLGPIRPYISPLRITAVTPCRTFLVLRSFLDLKRPHPSLLAISTPTLCREIVRPRTACRPFESLRFE